MNFVYLLKTSLRIAFALALFVSGVVFACQQISVLKATDGSVVGQGVLEEASDSVAEMKLTIEGQVYTGTGIIQNNATLSRLAKQRQGVRSDRAFLGSFGKRHDKQAKIMLVNNNGVSLACEFSIHDSELVGHCLNPQSQHIFNLKMISGAS